MIKYGIIKNISIGSFSPNMNKFGNYYAVEVIEEDGSVKRYPRVPGLCFNSDLNTVDQKEIIDLALRSYKVFRETGEYEDISHLEYILAQDPPQIEFRCRCDRGESWQKMLEKYHSQRFYVFKV